jgi:hypothetical protein
VSIAQALLLANDAIGGSNAGLVITAVGNASVVMVAIGSQTRAWSAANVTSWEMAA